MFEGRLAWADEQVRQLATLTEPRNVSTDKVERVRDLVEVTQIVRYLQDVPPDMARPQLRKILKGENTRHNNGDDPGRNTRYESCPFAILVRCKSTRLQLAPAMKRPGRAWVGFEVVPDTTGSVVRQTAVSDPVDLAGLAYWRAVYPLHELVFGEMLRGSAQSIAPARAA